MTFMTMTIGDLCVSPYNVRQNEHDANAIEGMAESLLKRGQLYPLVVHPMPRKGEEKPLWGALAGGRRLRSFKLLIERGSLPVDHPIDVILRDGMDEAELVEMSLAENLVRVDLRPYEVYAAVRRAHERGRTFAEIAETNGQTPQTIARWARLGSLEPRIFAALERQEISQEQAKALAATEDHVLQLYAFEHIMRLAAGWQRGPDVIRRLLKFGDREQRRLLNFVGETAYRDAGGRYELDLFADQADERGRICDDGILMQLVEAKLSKARDLLRAQTGRDVRFESAYPAGEYGDTAQDLEINPTYGWRDIPGEELSTLDERLAFVENEMAELEKQAEQLMLESDTAERAAAIAAIDEIYVPLEKTLEELASFRTIEVPAGDIFCTLIIEGDGELEIRWWWASRKAMRAAQKANGEGVKPVSAGPIAKPTAGDDLKVIGAGALAPELGHSSRQRADASVREEHGLSMDGVQVMRSLRREILRAMLVEDATRGMHGDIGQDYLIWSLARDRFGDGYTHERGIAGMTIGDRDLVPACARKITEASPAHQIWSNALAELKAHPSMTEPEESGFRAYRAGERHWKMWVAAIVAGAGLMRSANADGYRVPLHDELATSALQDCYGAMPPMFEATEEIVELLPRAQRLDHAKPHVDNATFKAWGKLKAGELIAPVTRALRHAKDWVHPLLQFQQPSPLETNEAEPV